MAAVVKIDASVRELIVPRGNVVYAKWWKLVHSCMKTRLGGGSVEPYIPYIYMQISEDDRAALSLIAH